MGEGGENWRTEMRVARLKLQGSRTKLQNRFFSFKQQTGIKTVHTICWVKLGRLSEKCKPAHLRFAPLPSLPYAPDLFAYCSPISAFCFFLFLSITTCQCFFVFSPFTSSSSLPILLIPLSSGFSLGASWDYRTAGPLPALSLLTVSLRSTWRQPLLCPSDF